MFLKLPCLPVWPSPEVPGKMPSPEFCSGTFHVKSKEMGSALGLLSPLLESTALGEFSLL